MDELTSAKSVRIGPVGDMPLPPWLASYAPRHVAWARLLVGDTSLGLMLLVRCGDEAFEQSEANELRAVAYRIALAIENGLLHKRMTDQLAQLHRLQELTAVLAGTLELDAVGQRVADTLVSEAAVSASAVLLDRRGRARGAFERRVGARARHRRRRRRCAGAGRTLGDLPARGRRQDPRDRRRHGAPPRRARSSTSCCCTS